MIGATSLQVSESSLMMRADCHVDPKPALQLIYEYARKKNLRNSHPLLAVAASILMDYQLTYS